ncbi:MAG: hypothetical protein ACYC63_15370 [Armatimonadota bacterium]
MRLALFLTLLLSGLPVFAQTPPLTTWPPREFLLKALTNSIEPILKSQDPATGRFGTQPWICNDQNVLLPLAAAWSIQDPANPWYHSERVLQAIARGGEALVEDQDAKGMWTFRKKDNSTWGQIHMPWTYSRWIRAYALVKDALPADSRAKWEQGLLLGFKGIRGYMNGKPHNIPCHHAMALYIAGTVFDNPEWREAAKSFMAKVVAEQDPAGFWSENFGPVIGYNEVYVDAIGVYYHFSRDPAVLEALRRAAQFHSAVLWPDGSAVACLDERQIYHASLEVGTPGFTFTPEGRGYLIQQMGTYMKHGGSAEYAAGMLLYGDGGTGVKPAAAGDEGTAWIGERGGYIRRDKPWQWALSGYACPVPKSRWIQDRHNLLDISCDNLGLVAGGGNTKLQPYWSTFTVGDCSLLKHTPGDETPVFNPKIDLQWVPTSASLSEDGRLSLKYGALDMSVRCETPADNSLKIIYEAPADQGIEAHLPLQNRGSRLTLANGQKLRLSEEDLVLTSEEIGGWFDYVGLRVTVPAGASLRWPLRQHDPYKKDGSSGLRTAKLVLVMPFAKTGRREVGLSEIPEEVFNGQVFEARDLKLSFSPEAYTKRLDDLGSQFLGARKPGHFISFTLPNVPAGKYELFGDFVMAYTYGIVQVSVDGQPVGQPFDAYCDGVDSMGERVSLGTVDLTAGDHEVKVEIVGKNPQAKGHLISVKKWLLRKL